MKMKKNVAVWDLVCYVIFPLIIWNFARDYIGDYYAMLLSSVPGIFYSVYRFILIKRINFTGLFLLSNLIIGTLIDVLAGSAIQMLWNNVIYTCVMSGLFLITIVIKKPIYLYFALDFVELQGANRAFMIKKFNQRKILNVFQLITFAFALRGIILALIKTWLITKYGVEAFDQAIIVRQVIGWTMAGISMYGFFYISKLLGNDPEFRKQNLPGKVQTLEEN
jgi:hypothetical protein